MDFSYSSTSRFRFRDHQEMGCGDSGEGYTSSDSTSVSSDADHEIELHSMTGKGIKHLCSELLELKSLSDEDFHKNIFSSYSAFIRTFEEVKDVENELTQLKHHVLTQKRLIKELTDGVYLKVLSREAVESIIEGPICDEDKISDLSMLEAYANDVAEVLDFLLSEQRLDEALAILEREVKNFQTMQLQGDFPSNELKSYGSIISKSREMIADQLIMVAENPRTSVPELQKALFGLRRLGDNQLVVQILLKYYHSRIAVGIKELQYSKTILHDVYIHKVAKFVFSMISQVARSFAVLYGETSSYDLELSQWACEETEVFTAYFNRYIKSVSETSDGLITMAEAVQFALSYCSLLEAQGILLQPCLVKLIYPCVEEVLQIHTDHFKKVIGIFTSNETWVAARYLLFGIFNEGCSSMVIGQEPHHCLLTNSGRKFVTLLQAITEDISPLAAFQMESSIFRMLNDLFTEFSAILERSVICETNIIEKGGSRISLAYSPAQQVSVIANLSTLAQLFSSVIKGIFKDINHLNPEAESCKNLIKEASERVKAHFCKQFISKVMSCKGGYRIVPATSVSDKNDSKIFHEAMPSVAFQRMFLELRKLEQLAEGNSVEVDWLMEVLKELMEAILFWISNSQDIWIITEEELAAEQSGKFKQFFLDMQFLVEITKHGGYFSSNIINASSALLSRMEMTFVSAGLDPKRDLIADGWATNAAQQALQKLQEIEELNLLPSEPTDCHEEKAKSMCASDSFEDDEATCTLQNFVDSMQDSEVGDTSEALINTNKVIQDIEKEGVVDLEGEGSFNDWHSVNSTDTSMELEYMESQNATYAGTGRVAKFQETKSTDEQLFVGNVGEDSGLFFPIEDEINSQHDGSGHMICGLGEQVESKLPEAIASVEHVVEVQER